MISETGKRRQKNGTSVAQVFGRFKQQAVRLYRERSGTYAETAREPGVDPGSLPDWVKRADAAQAPAGGQPL